jgi:hypothetical protein
LPPAPLATQWGGADALWQAIESIVQARAGHKNKTITLSIEASDNGLALLESGKLVGQASVLGGDQIKIGYAEGTPFGGASPGWHLVGETGRNCSSSPEAKRSSRAAAFRAPSGRCRG